MELPTSSQEIEEKNDFQSTILFLKGKVNYERRKRKEIVAQLQRQIADLRSELTETKKKLRREGIDEGRIEQLKRSANQENLSLENALQDAEWKNQIANREFKRLKNRIRLCPECNIHDGEETSSHQSSKPKKEKSFRKIKVKSGKIRKSKNYTKKLKSLTKALENFNL